LLFTSLSPQNIRGAVFFLSLFVVSTFLGEQLAAARCFREKGLSPRRASKQALLPHSSLKLDVLGVAEVF